MLSMSAPAALQLQSVGARAGLYHELSREA
jgi:hypothetical protein